MQRTLTLRRSRSLANLNLSVVDMRQQLVEVALVEPFSAARALHEMQPRFRRRRQDQDRYCAGSSVLPEALEERTGLGASVV
jgi:hypothetical protein